MKTTLLPSGNYRARIMIDKKSYSFTAPTKREAERLANAFRYEHDRKQETGLTMGEAIDQYIDSKRNVLSVTTVQLYESIRKKNLQGIMDIPLSGLTVKDVQAEINIESATHKPKTVANMRGLISATLKQNGMAMDISVPKNPKKILELPSPQQVRDAIRGTDIELPALLAMWLSCSMSEIRGIQVSSIHDGYVLIQESVVDVDGKSVSKEATKAYNRTRKLRLPSEILDMIKETPAWKAGSGYIVTMNRRVIYSHFTKAIEAAGLPHMTFHQLRHENASIMLMLGIGERYAMERGGWATRSVLQQTYQHTFSSEREKVDDLIDNYFSNLSRNDSNQDPCQIRVKSDSQI